MVRHPDLRFVASRFSTESCYDLLFCLLFGTVGVRLGVAVVRLTAVTQDNHTRTVERGLYPGIVVVGLGCLLCCSDTFFFRGVPNRTSTTCRNHLDLDCCRISRYSDAVVCGRIKSPCRAARQADGFNCLRCGGDCDVRFGPSILRTCIIIICSIFQPTLSGSERGPCGAICRFLVRNHICREFDVLESVFFHQMVHDFPFLLDTDVFLPQFDMRGMCFIVPVKEVQMQPASGGHAKCCG